ncbi:MAG: Nif3-like dinuclear metal center hexameric protein, partial [Peptococcaceae bacterium]|nr:Nif3-like dinuclear metal center hexameric protein [Peptococcaceae bacterium]
MPKAKDIYNFIDSIAPFDTALDGDNVGLLVGDKNAKISKVGVCLDITEDAVKYAVENSIDLIVSHHPVIFGGLKSVTADSVVYMMIKNGITAICAHTNMDCAKGGVNDCLCDMLSLTDVKPMADSTVIGKPPIARVGTLKTALSTADFAEHVKASLNASGVKFCGDNSVKTVAVCGGSGADLMLDAISLKADAFVTSEIKQHQWLMAKSLGITVVDAGHFFTENVITAPL